MIQHVAIPIVAIPILEPVRIVGTPIVETPILEPVRILETRIVELVRILETPILEPVRIAETPISEPVLILETPILVQIVETRILAPIGVRFVVQSVVQNVRSSADLERVFHHHPEQPAARHEPAQAAQLLQSLAPAHWVRCSFVEPQEQIVELSIALVAFVAVLAVRAVPVRGRYANAAVHHQAPRQAIVAPRQSDVG